MAKTDSTTPDPGDTGTLSPRSHPQAPPTQGPFQIDRIPANTDRGQLGIDNALPDGTGRANAQREVFRRLADARAAGVAPGDDLLYARDQIAALYAVKPANDPTQS